MTYHKDAISFWKFFQLFVKANRIALPLKPLHEQICRTLQNAVLGRLEPHKPYIIINCPPRIGKSKLLEGLAAWTITTSPESQMIYTSFSEELVTDRVRYIQETLKRDWYRELWGDNLGTVQQATHFTTTAGGMVYGAGTGATISGKGAGLKRPFGGYIAIDDPSNPNDALSQVEADKVKFWFENVLKSRRNSDRWCPIIVVMQRLSQEDLTGYLLEHYASEVCHIKVPALDPVTQTSNFPETLSTETLLQWKAINPFSYSAQYDQEPIVYGGNLIHPDDFVLEDISPNTRWERKIITADTGMKAKQANDNSCFECWGKLRGHSYLIDMMVGKWEAPELLTNALAFYKKHHRPSVSAYDHISTPVHKFLVEDKSSGTGLIQQMRKGGIPVTAIERTRDKVTRVQEILPHIVTHLVHINKREWTPAFLSEAAAFRKDGKQAHDDRIDPMCDALNDLMGRSITLWDCLQTRPDRFAPTAPLTIPENAASMLG